MRERRGVCSIRAIHHLGAEAPLFIPETAPLELAQAKPGPPGPDLQVRRSHSPRCRAPRASGRCGWPASGRCAPCTWRPLRSSSSCYDRRDPGPNAAASHPGLSTVAAASGLADCSPRESSGPKAPDVQLLSSLAARSGDSLGRWRSFSPTFWQIEVPTPVRFAQAQVEPGSRACSPLYLLKPESWGLAEGAEAPGSRCKGRFCDSAYPGTQAPPGQEMSNEEGGRKAGAGRIRFLFSRGRRRYPSPGHPSPTRSISSATSPVGSPLHTTVCPDAPPLRTPAQGRGRMAEASQPPGPAAPPASSGSPLCRDPTRRGA